MTKLKHWIVEQQDDLSILTLDVAKKHQNVLSSAVIAELNQALDEIEKHNPKGLIIKSAKPSGFIAGADVGEFQQIETKQQATEFLRFANQVINRIEAFTMPTVAMINGVCLGGGLELALACDYRVAVDQPTIRLGLPEVKLGIHPGFGGTVRLIDLIGVVAAMDLILSGRTVIPYVAKKIGMIDFCVAERQLQRTAEFLIDKEPLPKRAGVMNQALHLLPLRYLVAQYLKKQVSAKIKKAHYPAPYAVIELWATHGGDRKAMLEAEQQSVAKLITTITSKNLVKVFFLQQQLKKVAKPKLKTPKLKAPEFQRVHVIGGGIMGGDIAAWCVLQGLTVTLHDRSVEALSRATKRAHQLFTRKLKQPRPIERAMDRFQQDLAGNGAQNADVIIEAIFENAAAKIAVFSELIKIAKPDALLATNTSSIPLETITSALKTNLSQRKRLVGLHFFNPVANMQLIEIVRGKNTTAQAVNRAAVFANRIGRLPVVVKSSPGFLVNRVLMPYILEAVELLKEGVVASLIDKVATNFGMPMGPITLADTVGLDICHQVGENLSQSFGGTLPELLQQKVYDGHLGKKSGRGFYTWEKGRIKKDHSVLARSSNQPDNDIEDRLMFRYLNESVACLHEGIVSDSAQLDAALIFATGFAPFRGGPIHHIADQQPPLMLARLKQLHDKYGARFQPAEGWSNLPDNGHCDRILDNTPNNTPNPSEKT